MEVKQYIALYCSVFQNIALATRHKHYVNVNKSLHFSVVIGLIIQPILTPKPLPN